MVEASEHFNKHFLQNVEANTMRNPKGKKEKEKQETDKEKDIIQDGKRGLFFHPRMNDFP